MVNNDDYIIEKLNEPNEYQECYVAFLDMLGFKDLCTTEQFDCARIKALFNDAELVVLKYNSTFGKITIPQEVIDNSNIMIMSDSIVLSAPCTRSGILNLLYQCSFIQNMLLNWGVLLRGGLTKGKFFQYKNLMFGPALVEAYTIETEAQYPRVVVSDSIITELKTNGFFEKGNIQKYLSINTDAVQTQIELLIKQDADSKFFINYFNPLEIVKLNNDDNARENIEHTINKGLNNENNHVKEKYIWLQDYLNESKSIFDVPKLTKEDWETIRSEISKKDCDTNA